MLDNAGSEIPITEKDLAPFKRRAMDLLRSVSYTPRRDVAELQNDVADRRSSPMTFRRPPSVSTGSSKSVSLMDTARTLNGEDELLDPNINTALAIVRQGIRIALHIGGLYGKASGLTTLQDRNKAGELKTDESQTEFRSKTETQSAITAFVLAYYVCWATQNIAAEELSGVNLEFVGLPEPIAFTSQTNTVQCALFHFGSYLKQGGVATGLDFLKMTQLYFKAVIDDVKERMDGLKHIEPFVERSYRLEHSQFSLNGFHGDIFGAGPVVEFKRVNIDEVVGNRHAKLHAFRIAQALIAYDMKAQKNPMVELGGFPWVYLMKGKPGTGKTLLISAVLTLVDSYCASLGIPFRPHPLPNAIVSTFQGGSAENMENWMKALRNPNELIIAPIDDAENSFQDRTMQGVSSGVRELIGVFLRNTEGASAINRGNALIMFATNIPDQVDKAVLSRVLARMDVDGAVTREDFLDQLKMWTNGLAKYNDEFVDLIWPQDYEFLSAQRYRSVADRVIEKAEVVRDERLSGIIESVGRKYQKNTFDYYAALFRELLDAFPFFSSRDVRNIQVAVGTRLLDFDFPEEWLTNRERFVDRPYDEKRGMIVELMRTRMGTLSFNEILYEETMKYLSTMVSILDAGRERRITELVEGAEIRDEASRRMK